MTGPYGQQPVADGACLLRYDPLILPLGRQLWPESAALFRALREYGFIALLSLRLDRCRGCAAPEGGHRHVHPARVITL